MARAYGRTPFELMRDPEALAYNLTVYRTARLARSREFDRCLPIGEDAFGIGRIQALLAVIAEK